MAEQSLDVFGEYVDLEIDPIAGNLGPEGRLAEGCGDERNREPRLLPIDHFDDGEGRAVNRDRALFDKIFGDVSTEGNAHDFPVGTGRAVEDAAGAVDVSLNDVTAESRPGRHGAFEVDRISHDEVAEIGLVERFLHDVGVEGFARLVRHGEAAAVDADRVSVAGI